MCKTIKQKVKFKAPPNRVYALLADSKLHSQVTAHRAVIGRKAGDRFTAYNGFISGINVELVPGVRIVQAWRDKEFPKGIYSMATFNLVRTKDGGTELTLTHRGVPKNLIPEMEKSWRQAYWQKMRGYLDKT